MARYSDTVTNTKTGGTPYPIVGALVSVKSQSGTTPTLYADDGVTVLDNPLTTDTYGTYYFNAPADFYDLTYIYGGRTIFERAGVAVGTPTLPTGFIADAMGTATNVAPSQRAVSAAIETLEADITTIQDGVAESEAAVAAALARLPTRYSKLTDTTRTATTTLAADPDLQVPIPAGNLVTVSGKVFFATTAAADFKWRHTGPASPTRVNIRRQNIAPGDTALSNVAVDSAYSASDIVVPGAAGQGIIEIEAVIQNGGTAGSFGISWAQNTSDAGNTIVEAGSYLEIGFLPAALNVQFADSAIAKLGEWPLATYGGRSAALGPDIDHGYIDFIVSGYRLQAMMYGNGSDCTISIDGGAFSNFTPPAGWNVNTLFNGLTDGAHRVRIAGKSGTSNACAFDQTNSFTLSSHLIPSVSHATDIATGYFPFEIAPYSSYGALDTTPPNGGGYGFYSHPRTWSGDGFGMRFQSTTNMVQIWAYGYPNQTFILLQDGVAVGTPLNIPNDGVWALRTLATGLAGTHEYEIIQLQASSISTVYAVAASTLNAVAHPVRDLDVWYGDSIVVESVLTDVRQGEAWIVANAGGRAAHRVGTGGAKASTFGRDNTALVTGLPQLPVKVFECFGVNDMQLGVSIPTFQADVQTMLSNLRAGLPGVKIYCRGILPVSSSVSNYTQRSAYNSAKAAAVAALADPLIVYVNTDGWLNPATDLYDGLHPNATGYGKTGAAQLLVM